MIKQVNSGRIQNEEIWLANHWFVDTKIEIGVRKELPKAFFPSAKKFEAVQATPCSRNTGCPPFLGIRYTVRMYPSAVVTLYSSDG